MTALLAPILAGVGVSNASKNAKKYSGVSSPYFSDDFDPDKWWSDSGLTDDRRGTFDSYVKLYRDSLVTPDFWHRAANAFGATSSADMSNKAALAMLNSNLAQLQSTQREEIKNSFPNQAAEMRAAGVNPDLQGFSSGVGQASEINEPETPQSFPSGIGAGDVVQGLLKGVESAIGLYSGLVSVNHGMLVNQGLKTDNTLKWLGSMPSIFEANFSPSEIMDFTNGKNTTLDGDFNGGVIIPEDLFKSLGITSRKDRARFSNTANAWIRSSRGQSAMISMLNDYTKSKQEFGESLGKWFNNSLDPRQLDASSIGNALKLVNQSAIDLEKARIKFEKKYYDARNPESKASAENVLDDWNALVNKTKANIMQGLINDGSPFSQCLALQLMGQVDFVSNSLRGITGAISDITGLVNPKKMIKNIFDNSKKNTFVSNY